MTTLDRLDTVIAFAVVMLAVSLLITILTQMTSALFGLRGTNLFWGIKTLLSTVDPALANQAETLANRVLTHPLISDSAFSQFENVPVIGRLLRRWRFATAIRPDELVRTLSDIAGDLNANGGPNGPATAGIINTFLARADPEAERKLNMLHHAYGTLGTAWQGQVDKVVQQVTDSARQSVGQVETWFATAMDRVSQRFALHMRLWTVFFAFVVAFGVHLDSLQLLKQLATNPEQRNALVNSRDTMLKEAEPFISSQKTGATAPVAGAAVSPTILKEAMENLKKTDSGAAGLPATPDFASLDEATKWLQTNNKDGLIPNYQKAVVNTLKDHATNINKDLLQSEFQLIPSPYPSPWYQGKRNLLGMLITAAFLSLGAPFWFNTLKNLSNLRTVVASNEKKEEGKN